MEHTKQLLKINTPPFFVFDSGDLIRIFIQRPTQFQYKFAVGGYTTSAFCYP